MALARSSTLYQLNVDTRMSAFYEQHQLSSIQLRTIQLTKVATVPATPNPRNSAIQIFGLHHHNESVPPVDSNASVDA